MECLESKTLKNHIVKNSSIIATRRIFFSLKGDIRKKELVIKLHGPVQIDRLTQNVIAPHGAFVCYVSFSHLCSGHIFYGYDEFQVLSFASDLNPLLRALDNRCNLYFTDCAEDVFYFDDACNRW